MFNAKHRIVPGKIFAPQKKSRIVSEKSVPISKNTNRTYTTMRWVGQGAYWFDK